MSQVDSVLGCDTGPMPRWAARTQCWRHENQQVIEFARCPVGPGGGGRGWWAGGDLPGCVCLGAASDLRRFRDLSQRHRRRGCRRGGTDPWSGHTGVQPSTTVANILRRNAFSVRIVHCRSTAVSVSGLRTGRAEPTRPRGSESLALRDQVLCDKAAGHGLVNVARPAEPSGLDVQPSPADCGISRPSVVYAWSVAGLGR